jgi:adenylate cyclase
MEIGHKIQVKRVSLHSYGTRNNDIVTKTIDFIKYNSSNNLDWFTFKGGKTKYRTGGHRDIFSITGPERYYDIIK